MKTLNVARTYGIVGTALTLLFVLALTASCNSVPKPSYMPERTLPKYLEITTSVSGLKDETVLVTTHVYDMDTGKENTEWKRTGNGTGEIAIREPEEGNVYTIIAEAESYIVHPESYKVRITDDDTVVINNNDTGEKASQLDFQFTLNNASSAQTPKTTKVIPEEGDKGTIVSGSFPAFTLDELITHSDTIVLGKVTEILPAKWGKNPMGDIIYQDVIVQPERYLYGEPESEFIAINVWGGKVGDTYMIMDSDPVFTVGEKTLLFLHRPPKEFMATVPEGIDPRSYYRVTASIPGKHEFKDGILTDYRGQTTNISTVEEKIAAASRNQ